MKIPSWLFILSILLSGSLNSMQETYPGSQQSILSLSQEERLELDKNLVEFLKNYVSTINAQSECIKNRLPQIKTLISWLQDDHAPGDFLHALLKDLLEKENMNFLEFVIIRIKDNQILYQNFVRLIAEITNKRLDWRRATPLHLAAAYGCVEAIKILVNAGADLNANAWCGTTPLHWAINGGNTNAVKTLLGAGANVNQYCGRNYSPLCWAAVRGAADIAQTLIDAGANINTDSSENTAFDIAVAYGHNPIVKILLAAGACSNRYKCQQTQLHITLFKDMLHPPAEANSQARFLNCLIDSYH